MPFSLCKDCFRSHHREYAAAARRKRKKKDTQVQTFLCGTVVYNGVRLQAYYDGNP